MRSRLQREIEDLTERYRQAGYFPSACVRVFNDRETLAQCSVGGISEHAVFDVASLTKIATATQILFLVNRGKLRLEDTVPALFPEIAADEYLARRMEGVTLYRLLTHTSTLTAWYPFYSRRGQVFFAVLKYALQHTEPTRGMVYSDLNFMLLGKLLEKIQGRSLDACLEQDLAQPLALGVMTYHPDPLLPIVPSCFGNEIERGMCRDRGISFDGFRPEGMAVRGTANDGNAHYYFGDAAGHAGIFAEAEAYERLCRFYMRTEDPLLIQAQQEQETAPGRGIGFERGTAYPHGCGHTGFTGTGIYFSREKRIGVVSFTNRLYYPQKNEHGTGEFRRALHEAAFALAAE